MSAPSIYLSAPSWSMFKFPPDEYPPALPPPHDESTFKSPFAIPDHIYNGALDPRVPITIGTLYVISVTLVNAYNRRNGNKPWPMTKTRAFQAFVVLHNVFLAVYSGVTFAAMTRAADRVWPGFDNTNGLAGVADALCKMHGPRGLGDAVTFNGTTNTWGVRNSAINLLSDVSTQSTMTSLPTTAKGYGISDTKKYTDFSVQEFKLKTPGDMDIDLDIDVCGVCGSDVHTITGGWGEMSAPWICPGHEIIGKVTHVGKGVTEFKVGDRAGVGAQVWSCGKCQRCKSDNENYCPEQVDTYNAPYPDGVMSQGGYSTHIRVDQQFVFPIPESISSEDAAPMLCAGLTVYSPLVRNGTGPGKHVGIVGVGGLGHFAIQFAKALGAKVTVFSHSSNKEKDARKLGADDFISTGDEDFAKPFAGKDQFDFILSTADANAIPLADLLSVLKIDGKLTSVGLPDSAWEGLKPQAFASNAACVGGSHIGSKKECLAMLKLAAEKNVRPILDEILPMSQAGKAIESVKTNKVRYRFVLKNDLK